MTQICEHIKKLKTLTWEISPFYIKNTFHKTPVRLIEIQRIAVWLHLTLRNEGVTATVRNTNYSKVWTTLYSTDTSVSVKLETIGRRVWRILSRRTAPCSPIITVPGRRQGSGLVVRPAHTYERVSAKYPTILNISRWPVAWPWYSEGPATGHLDTGFSRFPCVYKQMLRWFPTFQVATTWFSCSPPDINVVVTNSMLCLHVK